MVVVAASRARGACCARDSHTLQKFVSELRSVFSLFPLYPIRTVEQQYFCRKINGQKISDELRLRYGVR
jgi:hypothetical protein